MKIFFWNKTASTENLKQGILETGNKNSKIPKFKHNGICEIEFVYDLNTNGTQTKIKKAPKDQRTADSKQLKIPKIKKQSSQIKDY